MAKKRQRRSAQFKFQVALEALKEQKTLSQLASVASLQLRNNESPNRSPNVPLQDFESDGDSGSKIRLVQKYTATEGVSARESL